MAPRAVVARETELDRLRAFLAGAESQSLVLREGPGNGKTLLWQTTVERGQRVPVHRAVGAEAALAFTGLVDLLVPMLAKAGEALSARRLQTLRVALLLEEPGGVAFDALGMTDRILFSSDDPHWDFDAPSQSPPRTIPVDDRQRIPVGNACRLYDLQCH